MYVLRYTDKPLVSRCRDFIAGLYQTGEPIASLQAGDRAPAAAPDRARASWQEAADFHR